MFLKLQSLFDEFFTEFSFFKGENENFLLLADSGRHRFAAEEILRIGSDNIAARVFTYRELAAATGSFSSENLLGEGGFGRVYKGQLKGTNEVTPSLIICRLL